VTLSVLKNGEHVRLELTRLMAFELLFVDTIDELKGGPSELWLDKLAESRAYVYVNGNLRAATLNVVVWGSAEFAELEIEIPCGKPGQVAFYIVLANQADTDKWEIPADAPVIMLEGPRGTVRKEYDESIALRARLHGV
jgi:hypothetical protein